jgi:hypothetical protein
MKVIRIRRLRGYISFRGGGIEFIGYFEKQTKVFQADSILSKCRGSDVTLCPATTSVLSYIVVTCESALFYNQPEQVQQLSQRTIWMQNYPPVFVRSTDQTTWYYSVFTPQHVTLRCYKSSSNSWQSTDVILQDVGIIPDSQSCFVNAEKFTLLPAVSGTSNATMSRQIVTPSKVEVLTDTEESMFFRNSERTWPF